MPQVSGGAAAGKKTAAHTKMPQRQTADGDRGKRCFGALRYVNKHGVSFLQKER